MISGGLQAKPKCNIYKIPIAFGVRLYRTSIVNSALHVYDYD